ncbi:hypothetical protein FA822_23185, partial [Escherichia coli]|nr:hypothetical protein [Escherichia coli]
MPESLEYLNVHNNRLTTLPALPATLTMVNAQSNALESLPDFPAENNQMRRTFWFQNNQITHIPESITALNEHSWVIFENNPLSDRTLQSLQQLMSSPDYHGPQIHFSMSDGQQHASVRSLPEAVAAWFPESLRSEVS